MTHLALSLVPEANSFEQANVRETLDTVSKQVEVDALVS